MAADRPTGRRLPVGLMAVGSEMAGFTIVGVVLDFALGTLPGFTIGLTILGVVLAFYHLVRMSRAMSRPADLPPDGAKR